jgi:hypothetical protein
VKPGALQSAQQRRIGIERLVQAAGISQQPAQLGERRGEHIGLRRGRSCGCMHSSSRRTRIAEPDGFGRLDCWCVVWCVVLRPSFESCYRYVIEAGAPFEHERDGCLDERAGERGARRAGSGARVSGSSSSSKGGSGREAVAIDAALAGGTSVKVCQYGARRRVVEEQRARERRQLRRHLALK